MQELGRIINGQYRVKGCTILGTGPYIYIPFLEFPAAHTWYTLFLFPSWTTGSSPNLSPTLNRPHNHANPDQKGHPLLKSPNHNNIHYYPPHIDIYIYISSLAPSCIITFIPFSKFTCQCGVLWIHVLSADHLDGWANKPWPIIHIYMKCTFSSIIRLKQQKSIL